MKVCPKCNAENIFEGAQFCKNCGAPLSENSAINAEPDSPSQAQADDGMDFVVTEPGAPMTPEFMKTPAEDSIEITSNASLLDKEPQAPAETDFSSVASGQSDKLIGDSNPHIPIPEDNTSDTTQPQQFNQESSSGDQSDHLKKLSQEEVANLRKQLYGHEKPQKNAQPEKPAIDPSQVPNNVIDPKKINAAKAESPSHETTQTQNAIRPIEDPATKPPVEMAPRSRGVAFFRGNFIQLVGKSALHNGDEIIVNNRGYLLRPKRIGKNATYIAFAAVLVILLTIIGTQFVGPTVSGEGEVIGVVLDTAGQPYLEGARVSIPSLHKSTTSNSQGFFRFHDIPTGTYEVEYVLGDQYWGRDNVTVVENQSTLTTCDKLEPIVAEKKKVGSEQQSSQSSSSGTSSDNSGKQKSSASSTKTSSSNSSSNYGKIALVANVPDARFEVDGDIQGSGNNTYSRIKPGTHTVKVNKPGYQEFTKKVKVEPGKTYTLNVDLSRREETTSHSLSAEDHYELGKDALAKGNLESAVDDLTKSINKNPGYAPAYIKRAEAYTKTDKNDLAIDDYVRAGEIYRLSRQSKQARDAFNAALKLDNDNKVAWVGLAGVRYDEGDFRPALTDYETALDKEKNFYPALYGAGLCLFKLGDYKKADKYFKKALKENATDPYLFQFMMLNSFSKDDFGKVRELYAEYKTIVGPAELAEFKASSRFAPILRIISEDDR